jgi:DNA-binding HxlR family transcriptional regulator
MVVFNLPTKRVRASIVSASPCATSLICLSISGSSVTFSADDRLDPIHDQKDDQCSIQFALTLVQGKWKIRILSRLQDGPARLNHLRRMLPSSALKKELTSYLHELESAGLIVGVDPSGRMPYAEYSLSDPLGIAALHLISTLAQRG